MSARPVRLLDTQNLIETEVMCTLVFDALGCGVTQ